MGHTITLELGLVAAFTIGLLGSTHCIGMCGGIVGALTMGLPQPARDSFSKLLPWLLSYNSGRLISYSLAGLLVGWLSASGNELFQPGFPIGGLIGAIFMLALGVYIAGWYPTMQWLERFGGLLWSRIEPYGRRLLPVQHHPQAFALGILWGWLPCGLVYSSLAWAATAADARTSAALMFAFGVGTLPALLTAGSLSESLRRFTQQRWTRYLAGLLLIAFGLAMLFRIASMMSAGMPMQT